MAVAGAAGSDKVNNGRRAGRGRLPVRAGRGSGSGVTSFGDGWRRGWWPAAPGRGLPLGFARVVRGCRAAAASRARSARPSSAAGRRRPRSVKRAGAGGRRAAFELLQRRLAVAADRGLVARQRARPAEARVGFGRVAAAGEQHLGLEALEPVLAPVAGGQPLDAGESRQRRPGGSGRGSRRERRPLGRVLVGEQDERRAAQAVAGAVQGGAGLALGGGGAVGAGAVRREARTGREWGRAGMATSETGQLGAFYHISATSPRYVPAPPSPASRRPVPPPSRPAARSTRPAPRARPQLRPRSLFGNVDALWGTRHPHLKSGRLEKRRSDATHGDGVVSGYPHRPTCYVSMPFGTKHSPDGHQIDFDSIYVRGIRPAIEAAGLAAVRADSLATRGTIMKAIYEALLQSEAVIADITTLNPNVFYELGVRHAVAPGSTILICADDAPLAFDVNSLLVLRY